MTDSRALTAVGILLGGSSRRMGTPKHELRLTGESTLLDRMIAIAGSLSETIVLCGDGATDHPCPRVEDRAGSTGPLAGIEALLHHVDEGRCLILPCDMPGLEVDDLQRVSVSMASFVVLLGASRDPRVADSLVIEYDAVRGTVRQPVLPLALVHLPGLPAACLQRVFGDIFVLLLLLNQVR